jgi:hypothetical protein
MDGFAGDVSEWPNVPGVATPLSIASGASSIAPVWVAVT